MSQIYVYRSINRTEDAIAAFQKAIELDSHNTVAHISLVGCYQILDYPQKDYQQHIEIARSLISTENEYDRACFAAIIGEVEEALSLLEIALVKKQVSLKWAHRDPDFESIRNNPRYQALVRGK